VLDQMAPLAPFKLRRAMLSLPIRRYRDMTR